MTKTVEKIIEQIDALTPDERGELAYAFLASFEPSAKVAEAWEAEVTRRLEDVKANKVQGIPAKELFAALRQRSRS